MYCLISVVLGDWRAIHAEAQGYKRQILAAASAEGVPRPPVFRASRGLLLLVDWDGQRVLGARELAKPTGFVVDDDKIHVALWDEDAVATLVNGELQPRAQHRWFNHIHTLDTTARGLLLSSSGSDLIAEVDADGELVWAYFMFEHGYADRVRLARSFDRGRDYNQRYLPAALTTHPNSAILVGDTVLATLFSTGELVAIDRSTGALEVVLNGLTRPHSIRRRAEGGYILSDTEARRVLLLDDSFAVVAELAVDAPWIQDAVLAGERLLVVANRRIVMGAFDDTANGGDANGGDNSVVELRDGVAARRLGFGPDNRIYMVEPLTGAQATRLEPNFRDTLALDWLDWWQA
ncbi:hypothetical protein [Enhygromyxa salina]|uniref:Uncharacterized protein n=1 Tax=Enhygromyxa salina TaxID=215803 RepID=A0A2S9YTM4_9BACT|nr:hypothetical protein [Enhygromyxa salina]PRQ08467.1 hypothetical protein ENSA7_17520 [Enhygromyxa salina]